MIQVLLGDKGSGKTKRLIDLTNEASKDEKKLVVFIDDDKRYMYDLRHEIRFVDTSEFAKKSDYSVNWLIGLIGGMVSMNFDISDVYIDAVLKHLNGDLNSLPQLMSELEFLSKKYTVNFVLSVSGNPAELPECVKQYAI